MYAQGSRSYEVVKAWLVIGTSLALGFCFDYFFYEKVPGAAFPLYVVLILVGLFGLTWFLQKRISKDVVWLLLPLLFFSSMVFVRSSELLTFLNVAASLALLFVIAEVSFGAKIKNFFMRDYMRLVFLPFKFILQLFATFGDLFARRTIGENQKILPHIIKGIVLAAPVLVVFTLLFSSADLIFQKYISNFIDIDIKPETIVRAILVLIVALGFCGAYSYVLRKKEPESALRYHSRELIGQIEGSILFGAVNILFFIFIVVQIAYLFGGESAILAKGFTYAEYARRGFFELIAVAVISLLLLFVGEKFAARAGDGHAPWFRGLGAFLVVQTIAIMVSASTRLSLYEEAYGFTTLRLYSHAFIILLLAIFCLVIYKIFWNRTENVFLFGVFVSACLFLVAMNLLNPDAFIARRNLERFAATGNLDVQYLGRLSEDALLNTIQVLGISNEDLKKEFARELYQRHQERINSEYFSKWQSANLSRMRAKQILEINMRELELLAAPRGIEPLFTP